MEDRDNSGVLFRNKRKEKDTQPDFQGNAVIGGVKKRLVGWWKTPKAGGEQYMSLAISEFDQAGNRPAPPAAQPVADEYVLEDDIPF